MLKLTIPDQAACDWVKSVAKSKSQENLDIQLKQIHTQSLALKATFEAMIGPNMEMYGDLPSNLFWHFYHYLQVLDKAIAEFDEEKHSITDELLEALTSHQEAAE